MSHTRGLIPLFSVILIMAFVSSCSLPAPVARLFATETPTPTPTPPVKLVPCPKSESCPGSVGVYDLVSVPLESGVVYPVDVILDEAVSFFAGWSAKDDSFLIENMAHMQHFIEIDGINYYNDAYMAFPLPYSFAGDSTVYSSMWQGVTISGWKLGEPHRVRIGFTFDEIITNGNTVYPAGTVIEYIYQVNPIMRPTNTPTMTFTPTLTPTPTPTATPTPRPTQVKPTAVPYTSTPSCSENASIVINNTTGGRITLYLNGPEKYTFYLNTGYTTLKVCSGSYSYTAYGCGGANDTGTINSGEEHEFYCY